MMHAPFRSDPIRREYVLLEIREEHPSDVLVIRDLNKRAFEQDQEGNIVDALRSNGAAFAFDGCDTERPSGRSHQVQSAGCG